VVNYTLDRGQWSATHSDRFAHGKELPVLGDFGSGLVRSGRSNILCPAGNATSQLATHNCARSIVTRPTCWHSPTAHNCTLTSTGFPEPHCRTFLRSSVSNGPDILHIRSEGQSVFLTSACQCWMLTKVQHNTRRVL